MRNNQKKLSNNSIWLLFQVITPKHFLLLEEVKTRKPFIVIKKHVENVLKPLSKNKKLFALKKNKLDGL
jgi:hypothetical protein